MGRIGVWSIAQREILTPNIAFVDAAGFPAPKWAELVAARSGTPRHATFGIAGSFFVSVAADGDIPLPDRSGVPPGLDIDLPREAARGAAAVVSSVAEIPAQSEVELVVLEGGPSHLDRPKDFARLIVEARTKLGAARVLAVPGIAAPHNLGLLVYCGIDLVDSSRMAYDTTRGLFHTADGAVRRDSLEEIPCACPSCSSGGPLGDHNDTALHVELAVARTAIRHATLRELAERRAINDPWSTAVLRELDLRHYEFQELRFPVADGAVKAYSPLALTRPDVVRFQRFVSRAYRKPPSARVLLLLPCSARKPYAESRTHRRFREAIDACGNPAAVHEVIVTSPLGLVPRELERSYPAAHYDIPVTGDWSRDEVEMLTGTLRAFLERNRYDAVIAHVTTEVPFVREAVPEAAFTATGRTASEDSLHGLTATLTRALASAPAAHAGTRRDEDVASLARFQFQDAGDALLEGASTRGRWPFVRIFRGGKQLGAVTDRGKISLALAGGEALAKARVSCVDIEDFVPQGNVFAVGVTGATADVRVGSEVAVVHGGTVRAVGVAKMNAREMVELRRGEAVHVRASAG